ncbi:MAG: hypothetical protein ACKOHM_00430 [Spartobacteria bacterium]
MKTRLLCTLFAALTLLVCTSQAQLLIYGLSLEKTGRSVNYTFFDSGYLVVDLAASTFSSVIVLTDPNTFAYYQTAGLVTGSYSTLLDYSGYDHAVLFGASSGTDNAALQVIGAIESNRNIGGDQRSNLARKLRGYFLASGAQVNASTGNGTTSNGTATSFEYGFAGSSEATATYDSHLTKQANNQGLDSTGALNLIGQILSNRGVPGYTPTPTPTP